MFVGEVYFIVYTVLTMTNNTTNRTPQHHDSRLLVYTAARSYTMHYVTGSDSGVAIVLVSISLESAAFRSGQLRTGLRCTKTAPHLCCSHHRGDTGSLTHLPAPCYSPSQPLCLELGKFKVRIVSFPHHCIFRPWALTLDKQGLLLS